MKTRPNIGKSRKPLTEDANLPIPDLTSDVRSFIASLGNSPRELYLKEQAWSKFVSNETDPPYLRKQRAIEKWLAQEITNAETNERLRDVDQDFQILPHVTYSEFMAFCTSLIETTIGAVPPLSVFNGGFSGGSSTSRKRAHAHPARKFTGQAHITTRAIDFFTSFRRAEALGWLRYVKPSEYLVTYDANQLFTVPKNTTIDRCACKEPDINMFLQKGLGNHIRRALRRVNVNLNDQSINRSLARQGSVTGELATLDLSSASDSVTRELVFQLMPICWFTLLDSTRSEVTMIGDEEHVNEMFSSMGNGFTFELESLIFWSLARTVCYFRGISGVVSVYGDDIIVPTESALDLIWVLDFFGFKVNPDKSFWTGSFRESCGGHYIDGVDITPFYIRRPVDRLTEAINLANNVRKWAGLDGMNVLDPSVLPLWEYVRHAIPGYLGGGRQLGSNTQVVDLGSPDFQLVAVKPRKKSGLGGYLHWLSLASQRESKWGLYPGSTNLRLVELVRYNSARVIVQFVAPREIALVPLEESTETSEIDEHVDNVYELRRPRKRLDRVPIPTWVIPGGDPDEV